MPTLKTNRRDADRMEREICDLIQSMDEWSVDAPECAESLAVAIATMETARMSIKIAGCCNPEPDETD